MVCVGLVLRRTAVLRLLSRTRYVFVVLAAVYLWSTPGRPLVDGVGLWSPTYEGALLGAAQALRVAAAVAAVGALFADLAPAELVGGLYALLAPFEPLGLPARRIVVRIWLTLHYTDRLAGHSVRAFLEVLRAEPPADPGMATVTFERAVAGRMDVFALLLACGFGIWAWCA